MEHSCPPRRSSALARLIGQNEVNAIRASDSRPNDVPHRKAAEGFLFLPFDLLLRRGIATPGNESRDTDDDPASQGHLRIFRACHRMGSAEARGHVVYRPCVRNIQEPEHHGCPAILPSTTTTTT